MYEIYEELISGIPQDLLVEDLCCCTDYCYVRTAKGIGIAPAGRPSGRTAFRIEGAVGSSVRSLAEGILSWNLKEASLGLAAVNSWYNSPVTAARNGVEYSSLRYFEDRLMDSVIRLQREVSGKKVAMLRKFPYAEALLDPICSLSVLCGEGETPERGMYPFTAYEALLPESDYVFLDETCLINKTFPRMLELASRAEKIVLSGPCVPLAPCLFGRGIAEIGGLLVKDPARAERLIRGIDPGELRESGQRVTFTEQGHREYLISTSFGR